MNTKHTMATISGSAITQKDERITRLILTVRAQVESTPFSQAVRLVYTEAVLSGAGKYNRDSWQDTLGNLGADISVSLDGGDIDYALNVLDTSLGKALGMFSVLFSNPTFSAAELTRIKTHLAHNLKRAKDDAKFHSQHMFVSRVCAKGDRRVGYDIDAVIKEVEKVTVTHVRELHSSLWNYEWMYTLGGSPASAELAQKTLSRIHSLHRGVSVSAYTPKQTKLATGVEVCLHEVPHKQNIEFCIGNALPLKRGDAEFPAFVFGMSVLGLPGGFTGRLMSIVREKEGLTYGIYGRAEEVTVSEDGFWRITTFFSPKDAVQGVKSTLREIARIQKDGITEDELKRFKIILNTRYALINDSLLKRVSEAHALKKVGIDTDGYASFKKAIQSLRLDEVNAVLATCLNATQVVISGAGPIASVKKELKTFAVSGK